MFLYLFFQDDDQYLGDICFSLRYVPTSGKVNLHFNGILSEFIPFSPTVDNWNSGVQKVEENGHNWIL